VDFVFDEVNWILADGFPERRIHEDLMMGEIRKCGGVRCTAI
jgi:hypothetical protein